MLACRLQGHQVNDVDDANLQLGKVLPQNIHRRQRLQCRHVACARHHHIRFGSLVVARPFPDADAGRAMLDGRIHVEPLQGGLFAGDDHVDIVTAAQAVIRDGEQRVRVRRQIDADDFGFLVDHVIDKARVLWLKPL